MLNKLYECLKFEQNIMVELAKLAEEQQKALITFDIPMIEELAGNQDKLNQKLREYEEIRIKILMSWLSISRKDALSIKLSSIERKLKEVQMEEIKRMRIGFKKLAFKLQTLNNTNRILANRAKNSVENILSTFTNGGNRVFNVRI